MHCSVEEVRSEKSKPHSDVHRQQLQKPGSDMREPPMGDIFKVWLSSALHPIQPLSSTVSKFHFDDAIDSTLKHRKNCETAFLKSDL